MNIKKYAFNKLIKRHQIGKLDPDDFFKGENLTAQLCAEGRENGQFDNLITFWKDINNF